MEQFHYRAEVELVSAKVGLDPLLVEAVVWQESAGDAHARRPEPKFWQRYLESREEWNGYHWLRISSSLGLMQIMPTTAVETRIVRRGDVDFPESLFRPLVNLEVGCTLLKGLLTWAGGDLRKALAAYNGGKGAYVAAQPQAYAVQVLAKYDTLKLRRGLRG